MKYGLEGFSRAAKSAGVALVVTAVMLYPKIVQGDNTMSNYHVYVGAYTGEENRGITQLFLQAHNGELKTVGNVAETTNPSYLAVSASGEYLYATSEVSNHLGKKAGGVSSYAVDKRSGKLTFLNTKESGGTGPCFVGLDPQGNIALAANYGSGSIGALALTSDGSLDKLTTSSQHEGRGPNEKRQKKPHAHSVITDPTGKYALAADLGIDKVMIYKIADDKEIVPNDPPYFQSKPGSGPRHIKFHPNNKIVYIINELDNTLTVCDWDGTAGKLTEKQSVSTLPEDFSEENTGAEVVVHPSGKFVYASNRGHDSIAQFKVHDDGTLSVESFTPTQGKTPRGFNIDPTGTWMIVANQGSDSLHVFKIDGETGKLEQTGFGAKVSKPASVVFVPIEK